MPPNLRVVVSSACENGSKILSDGGGIHADAGIRHGDPHDRAVLLGGLDVRAHDDLAR